MGNVDVMINEELLDKRINEMANELYAKYKDEEVVFVCILKGSVFFTCDLLKKYKGNAKLEFLKASSYDGTESTGNIKLDIAIDEEKIRNKNVVIVEDILDTGYTLELLRNYVSNMNPKSLEICVLLDKVERRKVDVATDYVGFTIDDLFVVGYGLDYNQEYRNLPYIGEYKKVKEK